MMPDTIITVAWIFFVFALGSIIGSFLNVVITRLGTGEILTGRSQCPMCGHRLRWYELVPLVSFFVLKGRCRACQSRISWQYPLVEVLTGALFVGIFLNVTSTGAFVYYAVIFSLFVTIAVYDVRHKIIPDQLSYAAGILAFAGLFFDPTVYTLTVPSVADILAGPLLFLPLFLLWWYSQGTWMGLGDAKLALSIGWLLGLAGGINAFMISFWIGAVAGLLLVGLYRMGQVQLLPAVQGITMKSEVPFGPFLIAGFLVVFLGHVDLVALILNPPF